MTTSGIVPFNLPASSLNSTQNIFSTEKVPNNAPNGSGKAPLDILLNKEPLKEISTPIAHQEVEIKPVDVPKASSEAA